jgi:hypothetical protein
MSRGHISQVFTPNIGRGQNPAAGIVGDLGTIGAQIASQQYGTSKNYGNNAVPPGHGLDSLDRVMRDIKPGTHTARTPELGFINRHFQSGTPPVPDVNFAPFKRPYMPNSSNVPVYTHRIGPMHAGRNVTVPIFLDGEQYGPAASNHGAMINLLPEGMPVWVCKLVRNYENKDLAEAQVVSGLNRAAAALAHQVTRRDPLMSYADFSKIWAPMGCVFYVQPGVRDDTTGSDYSILTVQVDGTREIPNLWLNWHRRLHENDSLWLVFVARTVGYEEKERKFMLEGNPHGFFEYYQEQENERLAAEPSRMMQQYQEQERDRQIEEAVISGNGTLAHHVMTEALRSHSKGMALSGNRSSGMARSKVPQPGEFGIRYARWETYVTSDGLPPPKWVYNTISPQGEKHFGGARFIGTVLGDKHDFDDSKRWSLEIDRLLYSSPTKMAETIHIGSTARSIPTVRVLIEASHA